MDRTTGAKDADKRKAFTNMTPQNSNRYLDNSASSPAHPPLPLDGVRVVEIGNLIAAPYAGMLLADLGAEVIKVEPPSGDLSRRIGPFVNGQSRFFMASNRGKRSVVVDTKNSSDQERLLGLVGKTDVLLSNLRLGALERMGLSEDGLRQMHPQLIYAVVTAFGSEGPYAHRAGVDLIFQAESGMLSITGHPGDQTQKTATTVADYTAATNIALAICAALWERERTGQGRRVEVSLRDGLLAIQAGWFALAFAQGGQPERTGTRSPFLVPNQVFDSADGRFALAIVPDRHFEQLCQLIGTPELVRRYPTNEDRLANQEVLSAELQTIFSSQPTEYWITLLGKAGLPVGRVLTLLEAISDPAAQANGMKSGFAHSEVGWVEGVGSPIRMDRQQAQTQVPAPLLGEHSQEVWAEYDRRMDQTVESGSSGESCHAAQQEIEDHLSGRKVRDRDDS